MEKEYAAFFDRGKNNEDLQQTLRALKVLSKNIRGSHHFSFEEIEAERSRLAEIDAYYAALEEKMQNAHKV